MQKSHNALVALLIALLAVAPRIRAQDMEPRAYANAPIGLNFLIAGYARSQGGAAVDPSIPLRNADIRINTFVLAYARSFDAWGHSAKLDVVLPRVELDGTAEFAGQPVQRNVTGWADPRLHLSINLHGAPALSMREFSRYRQDLIIGASVYVWAPAGRYDADRLVNIGTNRWTVKPELGASKAVGRWILDTAVAAAFYGDNDEYLNQTREQAPLYSVQGSVTYLFPSGAWAAVSGTWYEGGRTTTNGVRSNNEQSNSRVGVTLALPVGGRNHSIKLYASTGVSTRTGSDFDAAGIAWQYRWGGGL